MRCFIFALIVFLIFSCKKDQSLASPQSVGTIIQTSFDTVFPHPYLPVYPGSWWKYVTSSGDTLIDSAAANYVKDYYEVKTMECTTVFTSLQYYVPIYYHNQSKLLMWGYGKHAQLKAAGNCLGNTPFVCQVADSVPVGTLIGSSDLVNHTTYNRYITAKDSTLLINGIVYYPTIQVSIYGHWSTEIGRGVLTQRYYYTKNIGLVKLESLFTPPGSEMRLVSYFINP